ncbi:MAG: flagellar export chaperone FliS [Betaproteobacteria bacterium]|jgi:flagellar protein FliS|nr:flagellar export chaperone FliS [Betaproteobacteria bacterium]MBP6188305.1 flagellar export chaperone FliS [Azonexus sp.]MBP6202594.1 flagellar export chaperone FliS [Azonexus sp.]
MFGMMRSPAESYAKVSVDAAVETADPHRLVLMLFDGAMTAISLARIQMQNGQIPEKGAAISKAIDLITNGLGASLDIESGGDLAERLAALYEYMAQRLLFANMKNSVAALDEVSELLGSLRDAWAQIAPGEQAAA